MAGGEQSPLIHYASSPNLMARGHLLFSGFDKRALGSHCDRDVCLSKSFKGRDVGSGQEPVTLSAASHLHQGLWLKIRVALPRSEGRASHVDALGHHAPAFPSPPGWRGRGGRAARPSGVRWLGRARNLHPLQGAGGRAAGQGESGLTHPVDPEKALGTCSGFVWLLAFFVRSFDTGHSDPETQ